MSLQDRIVDPIPRPDIQVVLLLCGGNKDSQARDIKRAKEMAADLE